VLSKVYQSFSQIKLSKGSEFGVISKDTNGHCFLMNSRIYRSWQNVNRNRGNQLIDDSEKRNGNPGIRFLKIMMKTECSANHWISFVIKEITIDKKVFERKIIGNQLL
jgi:hypothetical protein